MNTHHTLGWCQAAPGTRPDQHHHLCPGHITTQVGVTYKCACPNHHHDPEGGE